MKKAEVISGYDITIVFYRNNVQTIETLLVQSRSEMLRLTCDAEKRGCCAWKVVYKMK